VEVRKKIRERKNENENERKKEKERKKKKQLYLCFTLFSNQFEITLVLANDRERGVAANRTDFQRMGDDFQ
jgi:hypothetical protein